MNLGRTLVVLLAGLLLIGCAVTGRTRTETRAVELDDAESVRVYLQMGVGELTVSGGAEPLMDAQFIYNLDEWEPEVEYRLEDSEGVLTVVQPSVPSGLPVGDVRYAWDVRLSDNAPMALSVDLAAGESSLMLTDLSLRELELEAGVGQTFVDLSGEWDHDVQASLQGGVGQMTVQLPAEMGVRVSVTGGLGAVNTIGLDRQGAYYVNEAFGTTDRSLTVDVEGGVGEVTLEVVN
jgi:hypothetical protein